jgi:RNA polymerase sigma-70 factor (ECF subfamily)
VAGRRTGGARAHHTATTRSDPDDGSLLVRARTQPEAFGAFYDQHHREILGWFRHHTGSHHLAAELTAETFAQALAGLRQFDPRRGTGRSWLFGIAQHQLHRWLRSGAVDRRHRQRLGVVTPTSTADEVERAVDLADAQRRRLELQAALDALSEPLRSAVLLRVGRDLSYAEVAQLLGVTEGAARTRVTRGLQQLGAAMGAR